MMPPPPSIFRLRLGEKIGSGAFSYVFQACETSTGRVVALKKSRVSLKVQRTIIHHEARILQLVAGHPSIPAVFAYGRLEHFEYLAMELLGRSLGDIMKEGRLPLKSVLHIADQMLSVLEHVHRCRIVHRDIKPNNIMTHKDDPYNVYLIDFGIARPCLQGKNPSIHNLIEERRNIVGTLMFASLNAHHGIDLCPRDDLESLAYTLLFLLRGELPWQTHCRHGTVLGRIAQIREKKRAWTGSRLTEGHPPMFGQLLDYARGLEFDEPLDYGRFRSQFQGLRHALSFGDNTNGSDSAEQLKPSRESAEPYDCPVEIGQLVHVQIVARTSIEGYSMQAGDPSYWHDPALSSEEWNTSPRPGIVVDSVFDRRSSLYKIQVISLSNGTPAKGTHTIPVSLPPDVQGEAVVPEPPWPMPETYCYAFPRATWFYCLHDQTAHAPPHWKISSEGVRLLQENFATQPCWTHWGATQNAPDPDVRYDTRMKTHAMKFFVKATALEPSSLEATSDGPVNWRGDRGWFDERVRIARRRGRDNGLGWTALNDVEHEEGGGSSVPNSYFESDYSLWGNRQQERDRSLTLDSDQQELYCQACETGELGDILEVV